MKFQGRRIKNYLQILIALCIALLTATTAYAESPVWGVDISPPEAEGVYSQERVIIKFKSDTARSGARAALRRFADDATIKTYNYLDISVMDVGEDPRSIDEIIEELNALENVEYAERDYALHLNSTPNDPRFDELWGLDNTGLNGGTADADIDADDAWDLVTGSRDIVVGVIDTGVDYTHEDLAANMWVNTGEIPGNNIDDDNNGYIDDVHGINAIRNDGDPMDDHSHGTHVSGTIGAVGDNGIGIAGVNWKVKIMALKFLSAGGSGWSSDAVECLNYAVMMKTLGGVNLKLTSNSWGGGGFNRALYDAIKKSEDADMLFIAAAGNSASDNDGRPHYPSSYDLDSVVSVAATNKNDTLSYFSCWGAGSVDLAAPGSSILSTVPGNGYAAYSGTSMATPHVAGAAALIWSQTPSYTAAKVKELLFNSADPLPSLAGKMVTGARLNVHNALILLKSPVAVPGGPYSAVLNSPVLLDAGASFDPDGEIVSYHWDWESDGTYDDVSESAAISHTWTEIESPAVTLKVTDNNGLTGTATVPVSLIEPLTATPAELRVGEGETAEITVTGGTAPYIATSSNAAIATVSIDGDIATVTGTGQGHAAITITDANSQVTYTQVIANIPLSAAPTRLTIPAKEKGFISILSGRSPYKVTSGNPEIAEATVTEDTITVTAADVMVISDVTLSITDDSGNILSVDVTVDPYSEITNLTVEEFGEGFTFDFDEDYDAGFGTLVFQVKDQNRLPVNGLTIENFMFAQNDIPADIESFSDVTEETILKVSLVLDASYSLTVDDADVKLKEAANALVEKLGKRAEFKYYRFANRVTEIGRVDELAFDEMDRFTSMYDAVHKAIDDTNVEVEKRIIVLFSDGADNHSLKSLSELSSVIEKKDITVYSVGTGNVIRDDLETISKNGEVVMAANGEELMETFDTIGNYLQSIYTVTYWTPSRRGIHKLGFKVRANGTESNTIDTLFEATADEFSAVPNGIRSPLLSVTKEGVQVSVSWEDVENADGYIVFYAPPDISFVESVDVGKNFRFEVALWEGFNYYIAVLPYNAGGDAGGLSNIELIEIR